MTASRRSFLVGLGAVLVTAPAIVRAASLMPVKVLPPAVDLEALLRRRVDLAFVEMHHSLERNLYAGTGFAEENQSSGAPLGDLWPFYRRSLCLEF